MDCHAVYGVLRTVNTMRLHGYKRGRVREIYFAGGAGVEAGAQMLTCYSRTYGKRPYPIAAKGECSDPRCCGVANHRRHSELGLSPGEWRGALMAKHPRELHVLPESIWDVRGQQRDQDKKEKTGI